MRWSPAPGEVRGHYRALARQLARLSPEDVARRQQRVADYSFQSRGITFAVNQGPEGVEKIMPFDLVPRLITPSSGTSSSGAWSSASGP